MFRRLEGGNGVPAGVPEYKAGEEPQGCGDAQSGADHDVVFGCGPEMFFCFTIFGVLV